MPDINLSSQYLEEAFSQCAKLGECLSEKHKYNPEILRYKVYTQLLRRIYNCMAVLHKLGLDDVTVMSINLTYRSAITDTYLLLYLCHQNDNEFTKTIKDLNRDHAKFIRDILPLLLRIGRRVFKPSETEDISDQTVFDTHYDLFSPYLTSAKGEPWIINCGQPFTTKRISEYFKNQTDEEGVALYEPFYEAFRVLSQTEHYSELGFGYSILGEDRNKAEIVQYNALLLFGMKEFEKLFLEYESKQQ